MIGWDGGRGSKVGSWQLYAILVGATLTMKQENKINLHGQWFGYYSYGEEYGPNLHGEKVIFSLLFDEIFNNKFKGKCIELSGIGAVEEISSIEGFIEDDFISFQKLYSGKYVIDEEGNSLETNDPSSHELSYEGKYDYLTKIFNGKWEIWLNDKSSGDLNYILIGSGDWEMSKDSNKYGV